MASRGRLPRDKAIGRPLPEQVVFLMSGDAWSGAMQAGALDALAASGTLPDCVIASGFGAINAVIAASNPARLWRRKLRAFWMAGHWIEWVTPGLRRGALGVAVDAFEARLDGLVDWQRLNAGNLRCRLIQPEPDGSYRMVDTAHEPIGLADVLASVLLGASDGTGSPPSGEGPAPEDTALREARELFGNRWMGFEIGLPPVAPSLPDDDSRARRRAWVERWRRRRGALVQMPWDADRRRPSRRSFRPDALYRTGLQAVSGPITNRMLIVRGIDVGAAAFYLPAEEATVARLSPAGATRPAAPAELGIQRADRLVGLLYKTVRKPVVTATLLDYSGDRDVAHYGAAEVTIPEPRALGSISRPFRINIWGFEIGPKEDPKKHFTLKALTEMSHGDWLNVIGKATSKEALVFVHGFNVTFQAALFRFAQIVWDLGYGGLPVLYSWASRGAVLDYGYDRNSALIGRTPFLELLGDLAAQGITRVHILAHSMGNFLVLDALSTHAPPQPLGIDELVMAAPDIDVDQYQDIAPKARKLTKGMTLYASSADKALAMSRKLAGKVPRAGDVFGGKPVLVDKIDTIDATAIGTEILGLNHSDYATDRSILNDVKRLLADGKRPPPERGVGLDAMPDDLSPAWWRFAV